jgi:hypothetical protein
MSNRWTILLAVLVVVALTFMSLRASQVAAPVGVPMHPAHAVAVETPIYSEDGSRTAASSIGEIRGNEHGDAAARASGVAAGHGSGAIGQGIQSSESSRSSLSVLESAGVSTAPKHAVAFDGFLGGDNGQVVDAGAAQAASALAAGQASSGPLVRATVVRTAAGTASINNSAVAVGFMFDPNDNPGHRLEFTGPQVSLAEFSLHGAAANAVTIDGQPAVAGQWYPLHAGLTIVAPHAVGIHVRPAPPHSNG